MPRSGGTVFLQVLVAAVFLAVIGGSVGLALGLRDRDRHHNAARDGGGTTQAAQIPQSQPETSSPASQSTAIACDQRVEQQARRDDLVQELYLKTELSEVWICRDGAGGLYYQGHRYSDNTWLFLPGVKQQGEDFVAINQAGGGTLYRVSKQQLIIATPDGEEETQEATGPGG
jgi:hypothetical protein